MRTATQRTESLIHRAGRFAALALLVLAAPAFAGEVYVSASAGDDANPGTAEAPFKTISAALAKWHAPGTTIRVQPGVYPEQVTVNFSGTAGNFLYLLADAAPGQPVVLEGADDYSDTVQWVADVGSVWRASGVNVKPGQVLVDGTRLEPDSLPPATLPSGHWSYVSGTGLYVNLGGDSPGTHQTWVSVRPFGFSATGRSWLSIVGFTIRRSASRGINLTAGTSDAEVLQNEVTDASGYGILASQGARVHLAFNKVSGCGDHGIVLAHGENACTLEHNESFSNARPAQRAANGIYLEEATANLVRWNLLHDNQDSGLQMDPGASNNQSIQNCSWHNGDHGFDHLGATSNIHVGDIAFANFKDGFSFEGSASGNSMENCIASENGLTSNEFDLWVDSSSAPGFQSNDNILWNSTAQPPVKYMATLYSSVSTYASATGQDGRTLQANPGFVDGPAGDFHLLAGSPAIDSGNSGVTGWSNVDDDGLPPIDDPSTANVGLGPVAFADRGALEFQVATTGIPMPDAPSNTFMTASVSPNPIRATGALTFSLPRSGRVQAVVVDASGRVVRRLIDHDQATAGFHSVPLNTGGRDPLVAGVYFYRVESADGTRSGRFVVTR
ncbi:MAG TPA: right-handed parallel beta-helix repeat-containing protein [Candidatus Eisenbacteria bacterium]|nr:right-handed parallel beta-helix repeat-containing protein [Candidatus Eisenbacteria bacterium]